MQRLEQDGAGYFLRWEELRDGHSRVIAPGALTGGLDTRTLQAAGFSADDVGIRMSDDFETRSTAMPLAFSEKGRQLTVTGYAPKWRDSSRAMSTPRRGQFYEEFEPGAFDESIANRDVVAWQDHEPTLFLGRTSAGTLRIADDGIGLAYEIDIPDTTIGRDFAFHMRAGNVVGTSFGFRTAKDSWSGNRRTVHSAVLHHVAPIVNDQAAYADTQPGLRSARLQLEILEERWALDETGWPVQTIERAVLT